jgi:hypothetical protein
VLQKKLGEVQCAAEVAWLRNFGWAPQRYNSRARPLKREAERWNVIWTIMADEAASSDQKRRVLAQMFLGELGGENSFRLVIGGLLADLAAEHYTWVATGDADKPDKTTVMERAEVFLARIHSLFTEGNVLAMPDTYTGLTLEFLRETKYYRFGKRTQWFGIGDWKRDAAARTTILGCLRRVQTIVENMKEYTRKVYRPEHSWYRAFAAFQLPSPRSEGPDGKRKLHPQIVTSLERICSTAKLPSREVLPEVLRLLHRAEAHKQNGVESDAAWGRASAEWPELKEARSLVNLFLIWKATTGKLERRFRKLRETRTPQRAGLLDITVEKLMLAEQAPPSKILRGLSASFPASRAVAKKNYLVQLLALDEKLHGRRMQPGTREERRDKGIPREAASASTGPETEAARGRKRASAIAELMLASPKKEQGCGGRRRMTSLRSRKRRRRRV